MNTKYFLILLIFNIISIVGYTQETDNRIFEGPIQKIAEVSTNTIRSDFGPAVVGDTLYFTSYSDKILGQPDKKLRKNAFYDLYRAKIDKNGNTVSNREPVTEFLTQYHDGPVVYCEKTGELFLTQSDNPSAAIATAKSTKDTIKLRIVIAKKVNGKWTSITNFPYNTPIFSVGHPAISITGDTLIFSSDMHGGFGQTDLYYSIRNDGKWGLPVNMGPEINTSGKEEFSFITHNKSGGSFLIFASNGRFGKGGLDLYYTRFPYSSTNKIEHFEAPINTEMDDFDMIIPPDAEFGYLSSNRPGKGSDDIYKFNFKKVVPRNTPFLTGTGSSIRELYTFNARTRLPIPGTSVFSCDTLSYLTNTAGKIGSFVNGRAECEVIAKKFGYPNTRKLLTPKLLKQGEISRDTIWMLPMTGKMILYNIYYDYDRWDILPQSAVELSRLIDFLNENPELNIQLGSHTDSRGSDDYNLKLSERRAQSAVNYIIGHGISSKRITGKGYGETQLLNRCANGVNCTPQEHRQNRRTEIFIPEYGKAQDVIQTEGQYSGRIDAPKPIFKEKVVERIAEQPKPDISEQQVEKKAGQPKPIFKEKVVERKTVQPIPEARQMKADKPASERANKIENREEVKSSTGYFLVIRSFETKPLAEKFVDEFKQKGVSVQLVEKNKPFRVGIKCGTFKEAKEARKKNLDKFPDCWILNGKK